jgi:hypothetical protein
LKNLLWIFLSLGAAVPGHAQQVTWPQELVADDGSAVLICYRASAVTGAWVATTGVPSGIAGLVEGVEGDETESV